MFNVRLAGDHLYVKMALRLADADDVFDGVLLCDVLLSTTCLG